MCAERRGGFTLLEAVFALLVLGMMSLAILGMMSTGLRTAEGSNRSLEAAALAEDRLTRARLFVGEITGLPDSLRAGRFPAPLSGYRWTAATRPVRGERDLHEVSVEVTWDGGAFSLATRVYRPTPTSDSGP